MAGRGGPAGRARVVFVHPVIRPYRAHIYAALQRRFRARFLVIGTPDVNARWASRFAIEPVETLPETRFRPYRSGVSWPAVMHALRDDYDVWIGSTLYAFSTHVAMPIVRARRRLFVLWTEDWYWGGDWAARAAQPYCRWILSHADLVIAAGSKQAGFLRAQGVPGERIAVAVNSFVPLGDAGNASHAPGSALYNKTRFRVLYLGRLLDYKGLPDLVRAYARLEQRAPGQTELCVVGRGPAEESCRRLADGLGLRDVHFYGRVDPDEVGHVYRSADVFVHPCRWRPRERVKGEAWGFVVNEAMACGLPVITTTAVAAGYDLIDEGVSGFVVPPGDVDELARPLMLLFDNPELRRTMGAAAKRAIEDRFQPQAQAEAFCDAIQSLCERRRR